MSRLPIPNIKDEQAAYIYAGFTIMFWSSSFPVVKYVLGFYTPSALILFRFLIASAALLIIAAVKKARLPLRQDIPYAAIGGAVGIFMYMWLFNTGAGMVPAGVSSFIIATAPIFSMLLSSVVLKEKISAAKAVGVFISAIGLVLVAVSQIRGISFNYGILILLIAACLTSIYNVIQRKISFKYTALECTTYSIVFATMLMFVFFPTLLAQIDGVPAYVNSLVVYLGVFPAAIAYLSWNCALSKTNSVTKVASFLYLNPFAATLLSFIFLDEVLSPLALAGGSIIIGGMIFANNGESIRGALFQRQKVLPPQQ